jgi:hypothetical protein
MGFGIVAVFVLIFILVGDIIFLIPATYGAVALLWKDTGRYPALVALVILAFVSALPLSASLYPILENPLAMTTSLITFGSIITLSGIMIWFLFRN